MEGDKMKKNFIVRCAIVLTSLFLILILSASSCDTNSFSLQLETAALSLEQGETGAVEITVTKSGTFNSPVSLSLENTPTGVTASFEPISTTDKSTLSLSVGASAKVGESSLSIKGSAAGKTQTTELILKVTSESDPSNPINLNVDKIILFPFTAENIKNPNLNALEMSNAPLGTTFALVGLGFSEELTENTLTIDGVKQIAWDSSETHAAFILTGNPATTISEVILSVKGSELKIPIAMDKTVPQVSDLDKVISDYQINMRDRFLSEKARNMVIDNFGEDVLARLESLKEPYEAFEANINRLSNEEKEEIAAIITESGFNKFFEDHPAPESTLSSNLFEAATIVAEIGVGVAVAAGVGTVIATKDGLPAAKFTGTTNPLTENTTANFNCVSDDTGVGESGLKSVTLFLNKGDGVLTPASTTATLAPSDPYTLPITFKGNSTGRRRSGNVTCRPTDGGGNIGQASFDFEVKEAIRPTMVSVTVPGPNPKQKQLGQPFSVSTVSSDKAIAAGEGRASGIGVYGVSGLQNLAIIGHQYINGIAAITVPASGSFGPQDHTQPLDFVCTKVGAANFNIFTYDRDNNQSLTVATKLTCISATAFHKPDLQQLPGGDLVGSTEVAMLDPNGNPSEFSASFDIVDEETVSNEAGVLFIKSGAGIDITLAESSEDPLFEAVSSIQVIVDPELCGGDSRYTFSVIDGPNEGTVSNDTSLGETVGFVEADGIRMFRIEATSGQLCVTDIGVGISF